MDLERMVVELRAFLDRVVQVEWLSVALTAAAVFVVTFVVARFAVKFLRHVLSRDSSPLPSSSIFVNIVRVVIWLIGRRCSSSRSSLRDSPSSSCVMC